MRTASFDSDFYEISLCEVMSNGTIVKYQQIAPKDHVPLMHFVYVDLDDGSTYSTCHDDPQCPPEHIEFWRVVGIWQSSGYHLSMNLDEFFQKLGHI